MLLTHLLDEAFVQIIHSDVPQCTAVCLATSAKQQRQVIVAVAVEHRTEVAFALIGHCHPLKQRTRGTAHDENLAWQPGFTACSDTHEDKDSTSCLAAQYVTSLI